MDVRYVFKPMRHTVGLVANSLIVTLLSRSPLWAQNAPVSQETDPDKRQISLSLHNATPSAILEALSVQLGRSILLDGEPLVQQADVEIHSMAKKALDDVAERLDCTWTVGKHKTILMKKRFSERADLPQMRLPEMQKMVSSILNIWPAAPSQARSSHYPFTAVQIYPANALFRAFTPEQVQLLQSGQMLAFAQLTPSQQSLVRLGVYNGVVGTSRDVWERLDAELKGAAAKGGNAAYLQWRPWQWEYKMPDNAKPKPEDYSLDYIWRTRDGKEEFLRVLTAQEIPKRANSREAYSGQK